MKLAYSEENTKTFSKATAIKFGVLRNFGDKKLDRYNNKNKKRFAQQ